MDLLAEIRQECEIGFAEEVAQFRERLAEDRRAIRELESICFIAKL